MSPISRETLAARIATLEADSNISIKEQFYLKTMRLLLAEMDKAPHHNGMMQLSNELANAKAALSRLSTYARTYAGDIQYTGDHPIAVAEKLAGQSFGNAEQLDTAPAQFESLVGYYPAIPDCSDADHVAAVLELIGSFDAADIEGDIVDLRFEVSGVDTGADVSITEYAARGAAIIRQFAGRQDVKLALAKGIERYGDAMQELAGEPVSEPYKLPVNTACKEAPDHIWLQTAGVWPENGEFSDLTWCSSNQHQDDTLYVRADLIGVKK